MKRFPLLMVVLTVSLLLAFVFTSISVITARPETTLVVTSINDAGLGTLRQALLDAVSGDTITFDTGVFPPATPSTIFLTSGQLPDLSQGSITIDATGAGVIIDGSGLPGGGEDAFGITSSDNTIRGLQIINFPGDGIEVCCNVAQNNLIDSNIISSNGQVGIRLNGSSVMSNTITGNLIGLDPTGQNAWPNGDIGVQVEPGASYNLIGGTTAAERNVISGHSQGAIHISGRGSVDGGAPLIDDVLLSFDAGPNQLQNADFSSGLLHWGTGDDDPAASRALNTSIYLSAPASYQFNRNGIEGALRTFYDTIAQTITFTDPYQSSSSIWIPVTTGTDVTFNYWYSGTVGSAFILALESNGNWFNLNATGMPGVTEWTEVTLTGTVPANVVGVGIQFDVYAGPQPVHNVIQGNYIGTDVSGLTAVPNYNNAINIHSGAAYNTVVNNVVSGNADFGVVMNGSHNNYVANNYLGVDATGTVPLGNGQAGVGVGDGGQYNVIEANVIGDNGWTGVYLHGNDTNHNNVIGNFIGTDASATIPLPNGMGVEIAGGAQQNIIGGSTVGERNIVYTNHGTGINISNMDTMSNTVQGNYIGFGLAPIHQAFPNDAAISPVYGADCTLYAATRNDGVHKSTDCGNTWTAVNNGLPRERLTQIKIPPDASNADTVYVLTNDGDLYVTYDGGINWSLLSTVPEQFDRRNLALSATFSSDHTMYAAAENWSWWGGPGVFKSTDSGVTWARMVNGMSDDHVRQVVAAPDPAAANTLFALTYSSIEKSSDGGATWVSLTPPDPNLSDLALSPAYAADQTLFATSYNGLVYTSHNGGATWSGAPTLRNDPRHLAVSPHFAVDQTVCHGGGWNDWLYCSYDGGATWNDAYYTTLPGHLDEYETGVIFSPNFAADDTIFVVSGAGVARSTNAGPNWELLRGLNDLGNADGIWIGDGASANTIGPDNVISNNFFGVSINSDNTGYNIVTGNMVGTDPTGTASLGNGSNGVSINGGHDNLIGGANPVDGNLISGNMEFGMGLWNANSISNTIANNFIGTDVNGAIALGNGYDGVHMNGPAYNVVHDNLISGNGSNGVALCCTNDTHDNVIESNQIGTDVSGSYALPNRYNGVGIDGGAHNNQIRYNLVSGNGNQGIGMWQPETMANSIEGNFIGTDATGTFAISNGNDGIHLNDWSHDNIVIDNLVSGNHEAGILIAGFSNHNNVSGNRIGTDATGTGPLAAPIAAATAVAIPHRTTCPYPENDPRLPTHITPDCVTEQVDEPVVETAVSNRGSGVHLTEGATNNTIGLNNIIAFNGESGVLVEGSDTVANTLSQNSIFANSSMGIALRDGGNTGLHAPRVTDVDLSGGIVNGTACANCDIEVFSDDGEEGRIYEGTTTADAAGNWSLTAGHALTGPHITATATDAAGNTSPFSALFEVLWVNLGLDHTRWALDRLGFSYTEVAVADIGTVNLADYDVMFVGSTLEWVPPDIYQPLLDHQADISTYVQNGGNLVVLSNGGDWGNNATPLDWAWTPVTLTTNEQTHRTHIITPTFDLVEGFTDANLFYWWGAHGEAFTSWNWPEAVNVVQASQAGRSALLAGPYGAGRMVLTGMFPDAGDSGDAALNALLRWAAGYLPDEPPQVRHTYPEPDGWAAPHTRLRLNLNQLLDPATVMPGVLTVVADSGPVAGTFAYYEDISQIFFTPSAPFTPGELVTATLAASITDWQGNPLDGDYVWQFTVRAGVDLVVTSTANEGPGTLRWALDSALPGDTIRFDTAVFPSAAPATIVLDWGLPELYNGYLTIDASDSGVILDASNADWPGLGIRSDGNVLQGLTIMHAPGSGLDIGSGSAFNHIGGDRSIGAGPNGQGNTIGFSGDWGITIYGGGAISNTLQGNYVGLDPTGTTAWPNGLSWGAAGLYVEQGADYTQIGGAAPGERNVLSGNHGDGLGLNESYHVIVLNNYLGTDASGMNAIPNGRCGLDSQGGTRDIYLEGNVFSGNDLCGAQVDDPGTGTHTFINNLFGVNAAATAVLPTGLYALDIFDNVDSVYVEGNIMAGADFGLFLTGNNHEIRANAIGTDMTGTAVWGNARYGIQMVGADNTWWSSDANNNLIVQNIVAYNDSGISIETWEGGQAISNTLSQNSIFSNGNEGISLLGNANNQILPPIITTANPGAGTASGTACSNCTVEIFSDDEEEGRWYEGTVTANGSGNWSFNKGSAFNGPNAHATATDVAGNTSEFSGPPPTITAVYPDTATPGTNDLGVDIFGMDFRDNPPLAVDFGADISVNDIVYHHPGHVTAYVNIAPGATIGFRDVTLTNYDGQMDTLLNGFEVVSVPPPPPVVTAVSPDALAPGSSGMVTVHGQGLINRPTILLSGTGVTVDWVNWESDTVVHVGVTVSSGAALGSRNLTLTNPDGQSAALTAAFAIVTPYFTNVAPALGVDVSSGENGAAWGDLDGDGWLDLTIGNGTLFTNTAGTAFVDATAVSGLDPIDQWGGAAWGDYDNDSKVDLLSSWRKIYRQNSLPFTKVLDENSVQRSLAWVDYDLDGSLDAYTGLHLYHYDGGSAFTDVTAVAGLTLNESMSWMASVWADYDNDGDPDLYLTCNGCPNKLYRNNGDGTFNDVTATAGVGDSGSGHGAAWGDYDNDGDFDLFVANNNWEYNVLYRNNGNGTFQNVSGMAGFQGEPGLNTGASWLDYNLDGRLDLFVVNRDAENRLYRNNGNGTFTDYRLASGANDNRDSDSSTVGDYDNDGDPDIYVTSGIWGGGTPNFLFRNDMNTGSHWLKVKLVGTLSNQSGIGAVVRVYGAGPMQMRQWAGSNGYLSQDALEAIFGLGAFAGNVTVEVIWPSGVVDTIPNVATNQLLVVTESTPYLHDMAMVNMLPDGDLPAGVSFTPLVTVRNLGQFAETNVPINCLITYNSTIVYDQTLIAGTVPAAAWSSVSFPAYTPATTGTYVFTCTVTVVGDERPSNDTLSQNLTTTQQIQDAWTKDNPHDDGSIPSGVNNWYGSPDIWVRHNDDGGLIHQDPIAGITNTVYVRLRNRGNVPVSGTLDVTWIEPSLGVRCGDWAPIGTVAFSDLLPGEQRIVSTPWIPSRTGHSCMQSIIDAVGDPYNRGLECAPEWVPWDNNISWRNINIFANPATRLPGDIQTGDVQLVNVYLLPQDVDVVIDRMTFPANGTITVHLPDDLFERWLAYQDHWGEGIEVLTDTQEIVISSATSGTIGAIPMRADEAATMELVFDGPAGLVFEMAVREVINGITIGGVGYQWEIPDTTPPTVTTVTPADQATTVPLDAPLVITFNEAVGPLSVQVTAVPALTDIGMTWNEANTVFTLTHAAFTEGTPYTISVTARDAAGNQMTNVYDWSFTTFREGYVVYLPVMMQP